ncbi:MAG: PhnD/SsuA/transferrin family substrate-binding protein [Sulfurospirillum sp.]
MYFGKFFILLLPFIINAQTITIAVRADHSIEHAVEQWTPTVNYLNKKLSKYNFKLKTFYPKEFIDIKKQIIAGKIDFVITQPVIYIDLESTVGISKILTLKRLGRVTEFGSVIIASKKSRITKLSQINENTRIDAVAPFGFGGWLIGLDTFIKNHVKFNKKNVSFLDSHVKIVNSILNNEADIGIIRTGVLEELQARKQLDLQNITILHKQHHEKFPFICSTALYPEWAFAKTKNISDTIAREVTLALLMMPKDSNGNNKNKK